MATILIVDDDDALRTLLRRVLMKPFHAEEVLAAIRELLPPALPAASDEARPVAPSRESGS
jgi:DNA-binding response OmpR family regulator